MAILGWIGIALGRHLTKYWFILFFGHLIVLFFKKKTVVGAVGADAAFSNAEGEP